ncbi:hypothetical protein [uncultured Chitinophaga sp.]|jgi:hypothetical protein|uniref:hypothetical protein n=1 Tax=uncultured Chitinophaga sp. TaxID=339340 RepID=UPI002623C671|nr:hypothetical protein [uncultured Chitinophaga sp.]
MLVFNTILLIHSGSFLGYLFTLAMLWPQRGAAQRNKTGLVLGIIILLTGIGLVLLKYPQVNYFKIVPKTVIFLAITAINVVYAAQPYPRKIYYLLIGLTVLAGLIAVTRL